MVQDELLGNVIASVASGVESTESTDDVVEIRHDGEGEWI
jgi:hypothetical protein